MGAEYNYCWCIFWEQIVKKWYIYHSPVERIGAKCSWHYMAIESVMVILGREVRIVSCGCQGIPLVRGYAARRAVKSLAAGGGDCGRHELPVGGMIVRGRPYRIRQLDAAEVTRVSIDPRRMPDESILHGIVEFDNASIEDT